MATEMKRPTKKKYPSWPKAPKVKSLKNLESHESKTKAIASKRDAIDREFEAAMKKFNAQKKRKESIIAGIGKLKNKK